jgi:ferredoxin
MPEMNAYLASTEQLESWLIQLAQEKTLYFPRKTEGVNYTFEPVDPTVNGTRSLDFSGYRPTILPPVKNLFPDGEILLSFNKDEQGHYHFNQISNTQAQILAGVRACDLKGIYLLDTVFSDGIQDSHYLQRRQQAEIIAFNCLTPCDDHCFCEASGSLDFQEGADVFVTRTENQWLIEILTDAGQRLTEFLIAEHCEQSAVLKADAIAVRPKPFGRQFVTPVEEVTAIVHQQDADEIYQNYAERCFSCGTCNLVCPTCYCFETKDELSLDGKSGQKTRHWDACMNPGFAEVAGGHNFRAESADRQRHRIRRKFDYLPKRFDEIFCTGCGRCGRQCTTGIDIFDIVNDVCSSTAQAKSPQSKGDHEA